MWRELWGLGQKSCLALWKPLISEANQKKGFNLLGSVKIGALVQWAEVMWRDRSRFPLSQSDGWIGVGREAEEAMHPSGLVPTGQAWRDSAPVYGCCSCSGPGSATFWAREWGQLTTWIYWPGCSTNGIFFLPRRLGHIPRWHCQDRWGSNCKREHEIFVFARGTSPSKTEKKLLEGFMQDWTETNHVTLQKHSGTMPRRMCAVIKVKSNQRKN